MKSKHLRHKAKTSITTIFNNYSEALKHAASTRGQPERVAHRGWRFVSKVNGQNVEVARLWRHKKSWYVLSKSPPNITPAPQKLNDELVEALEEMVNAYWGKGDGGAPPKSIVRALAALGGNRVQS